METLPAPLEALARHGPGLAEMAPNIHGENPYCGLLPVGVLNAVLVEVEKIKNSPCSEEYAAQLVRFYLGTRARAKPADAVPVNATPAPAG